MSFLEAIFYSGFSAVLEYLSQHVLLCLVPAFFIAGAMAALLPRQEITKHLGKDVPKYRAYPLAVLAGFLLAVCSCTILPLFAGIKKKGAGLGPAIAFLYAAPAFNILAITLTGSVLGWDLAIARMFLSSVFAVCIGLIMVLVFKEEVEEKGGFTQEEESKSHKKLLVFFATLFLILVIGASGINVGVKAFFLTSLVVVLALELRNWFTRAEVESWLKETYGFFKLIFPLLLAGVFVAGALTPLFPENSLATYVGENTVFANLVAVLFGVFMYFPTLVEVPVAELFLGLGMAKGPLLAYLLADPVLSIPSLLVVRGIIGNKKTLVYAVLVTVFCVLAGLIYGTFLGVI
jgi:hypothetical protein